MSGSIQIKTNDKRALFGDRNAERFFARITAAPLIRGNSVRLLKDARENYPAWLDAINRAERWIHFESYIIHEDKIGDEFADAFKRKAREGVRVRVIYDWLGGFGKTSKSFWRRLCDAGVEVRAFNPPRLDSPFGWISRDHRKMIAVDGRIAFVTGLCVGQMWAGDPSRGLEPWRDTGIEIQGPAVADTEAAFARAWEATGGAPLPANEMPTRNSIPPAGDYALRVIADEPGEAEVLRLDALIAAGVRRRLWLTDAYFVGSTAYVQGLRSAARDGVDVRLLVPSASDISIISTISRAGYRPLLEAGVRVFEWNGTMIHAKTAVADGRWARIGSTNLNIASWLNNWELDVAIEDERFAREMEEMYLQDLQNATEIFIDTRRHVHPVDETPKRKRRRGKGAHAGSANRAAAGAIAVGNAIGAAVTNRRALGAAEAALMMWSGAILFAVAAIGFIFPKALAYPVTFICAWVALTLFYKAFKARKGRPSPQAIPERRETKIAPRPKAQKTQLVSGGDGASDEAKPSAVKETAAIGSEEK
jgi:cardiolipin synthase